MIVNKTKHKKYNPDWQNNLKWLSKPLGKDEQTKFLQLLEETTKKAQEKQEIQTQLNKLESEKKKLGDIVGIHRRSLAQLTALQTQTQKKPTNFLDSGTNQYGWWNKTQVYYPTTYSDNLYEGTVNGSALKITEQEAIKLLTRSIKAFEKIEATKFATKFTASTHTSGTDHLPEIQKLAKDGLKDNKIIGKDAQGNDLPDKGKPANHAKLNRLEYSFKSQFVDDVDIKKEPDGTAFTPQTTEKIDKTKVDNFFAFLDDISKNGTLNPDFLTELQSDADILKDIENNTEWKILPAQSNPLKPEELTNYGIKSLWFE